MQTWPPSWSVAAISRWRTDPRTLATNAVIAAGRVGIVVEVDDQQAAELTLPPVGQHGVGERSLEADHDHRPDLLVERQPTGSELLRTGSGWRSL